ncbi:hypothetical protein QYF36_015935 [Acer negundo]|nr:hypothetical protein QYF36_015935 [Acer negundo]
MTGYNDNVKLSDHGASASTAAAAGFRAEKPARSFIAQKASDDQTRCEIVNGIVKAEDGDVTKEEGDNATEEEGVPNFWFNAMKFNEALAKEISKRDEGALKYLQDIKWCRVGDPKGFKLEFLFDPNPYFKNSVLTKKYPMSDNFVAIPEKSNWTQDPEKKIWEMVGCESFFNFFKAPMVLEDDTDYVYHHNSDDDHNYDFNFYKDEEVPKDNSDDHNSDEDSDVKEDSTKNDFEFDSDNDMDEGWRYGVEDDFSI